MSKSVSVDEAIAKLDEAITKYGTPDDPDVVQGVLAGPDAPVHLPENLPNIDHLALEPHPNSEVDSIFKWSVRGYIAISDDSEPSEVVLEILRHLAEVEVLRREQGGSYLEDFGEVDL